MTNPSDLMHHSQSRKGDSGELISVTPATAGWKYTSLSVRKFAAGDSWAFNSNHDEVALVPLGGRYDVRALGQRWQLGDRPNVFAGQPWALYLPTKIDIEIIAETAGELAICGARAERLLPPVLITPDDVQVEIRGAGNAARQINHIVKPEFAAHRLLIVEVFTPSGNWSSFPPHKHDVSRMPAEADLEEIYYYRIDPAEGFGLQRLYTADGSIDAAYVIHDGDLLLVPEGYHTFAVAQGYTGYYLNVLAGDEPVRTMQPADDPRYAWVRETWTPDLGAGLASWRDIDQQVNRGAGRRVP